MQANRRRLQWSYLGRVGYTEGVGLQDRLRAALLEAGTPHYLPLLEHPHVYTFGRRAEPGDLVAAPAWLAERGVEVAECDRGGRITYHGPGQLVGYPIIDLKPDRRDLRRYVHDLQEVLVRTLAAFGVEAEARHKQEAIGVWAGESKIASIGVHLSRWITTHGFALNVTTDLSYFDGIVPCGLPGVRMASIESLTGATPALEEVAERCAEHFAAVFACDLEPFAAPG